MTAGVGTTLTMGYDGLRRLTSVTGGPVSRQYTYRDIDSTKTTLQVASVTSGGQRYGYTYDSMGNIATYTAPGKGTVTYTYDNQGQLLKALVWAWKHSKQWSGNITLRWSWKGLLLGGELFLCDKMGAVFVNYRG